MAELADQYAKKHLARRAKVREESEAANPRLVAVRKTLLNAILSLHHSVTGQKFKPTDSSMYLIAQYIQGIELSYASIMEGLYPQAASLQKQQIEILAALEEIRAGIRVDGKTPNPKHVGLEGLGRQYGALNDAAHPSKVDILESLSHFEEADRQGPTSVPELRQVFCEPLLSNHALYLLYLWRLMSLVFQSVFELAHDDADVKMVNSAFDEMLEMGVLRHADD